MNKCQCEHSECQHTKLDQMCNSKVQENALHVPFLGKVCPDCAARYAEFLTN